MIMADNETDEMLDMQDMEDDLRDRQESALDYPMPEVKDNVFKFFRELLRMKDSSKVGNLKKDELGSLLLPVRNYRDIGNYNESEGQEIVAAYLNLKAETILATSLSRDGFLPQLFVTQIKKEQKVRKHDVESKGWFNRNVKNKEEN